jgi:hypothetical protein
MTEPMNAEYPAQYRDRHGVVAAVLRNDGRTLSLSLRGVEFRSDDFDGFEPDPGADPAALASFTLHHGYLCACTMNVEMPLPVVVGGEVIGGVLSVHLELGDPKPNGSLGLDHEALSLDLMLSGVVYRSASPSGSLSGWFEDQLLDLQRQLPEGAYLKACITCALSDYHPVGHGGFGGLACFRDNKEGYLAVRTKNGLFGVWDTMTGFVQETYLCPEFRRREPGAGYRG